jgi:6-phosphogluconate dehydrogenase (decarboxylating)
MGIFLVTYDIKVKEDAKEEYPGLLKAIRALGQRLHALQSVWLVRSSQSTKQIKDDLKKHLRESDKLLVVKLTGDSSWTGFFSDKARESLAKFFQAKATSPPKLVSKRRALMPRLIARLPTKGNRQRTP